MTSNRKILLIADKTNIGEYLGKSLAEVGFDVNIEESWGKIEPVLENLNSNKYSILIVTNNSLTPRHIPPIVAAARKEHPELRILVLSGASDLKFAIECKKSGADDFMSMPFDLVELIALLDKM